MQRQAGAILVMFTIGLFAIIAVAALALDGGDMLLNKGRIQNAVDASALHAAKALDDGATLAEARQAAVVMLAQNLAYAENNALETHVSFSAPNYNITQVTSNISVEFSALPDPFIPTLAEGSEYVRVRVENIAQGNFLAQIMSFNKRLRASAVAGRSTDIMCNHKIVPLLVCAASEDPDDPNGPYGIETEKLYAMKSGSAQDSSTIGPGNFQLLALSGTGGNIVRKSLAGEYSPDACVGAGDTVPTEPGNNVGPVSQGINTRFGQWQGGGLNSIDHPRDRNICQGERVTLDADGNIANEAAAFYTHGQYLNDDDIDSCIDTTIEVNGRREMPVVIGLCDGLANGRNDIDVLSIGCFFLVQDMDQGGQESFIVGEFVEECAGTGNASIDPNFVSNNYTIVLYRDPDSPDS
ncbi:pilus assembly protein TadG-related protein [Shewanella salipaludis]|nr:pilus assembly protein TadG-related protein [Shewanella salipaludis]